MDAHYFTMHFLLLILSSKTVTMLNHNSYNLDFFILTESYRTCQDFAFIICSLFSSKLIKWKILWFNSYIKIKGQSIDGDCVLSGKVLHDASQKGLGEEEARQPEGWGLAFIVPFLKNKAKENYFTSERKTSIPVNIDNI